LVEHSSPIYRGRGTCGKRSGIVSTSAPSAAALQTGQHQIALLELSSLVVRNRIQPPPLRPVPSTRLSLTIKPHALAGVVIALTQCLRRYNSLPDLWPSGRNSRSFDTTSTTVYSAVRQRKRRGNAGSPAAMLMLANSSGVIGSLMNRVIRSDCKRRAAHGLVTSSAESARAPWPHRARVRERPAARTA